MDQVAQIREKIDLVSLISEYVPLRKMGNNFKANCPFHNENTPSFVVSPDRQIWHCFGCQKGGDCFTFLMEYEHMEFPEALRTLAQKTGVELTNYKYDTSTTSQKEKLYKINYAAIEFYHYVLTQHPAGKQALQYLVETRLIKPQTIKTYKLGFSPTDGTALTKYLLGKKKFEKEDVVAAGLANQFTNRIKDFFQGRIMFPLYDHRGNAIGFSGRVLHDDKTAKYINTRETLIYHKGSVFFGLNSSKDTIKRENHAIIMEGEFDVISCFQEGITNTVAVKGTALTEDQVTLLSRFAQKISLCFDGDKAGQEAVKRSLPILERKGLTTTVILTPDGKDPDESIKHNPTAFKLAVKHDIDIYDYLFDLAVKAYGTKTAESKKLIGDALLPVLQHIQNEIVKEHHLRKLSDALHVSYESLQKEMDRLRKHEIVKQIPVVTRQTKLREELLENYLISLLVQNNNPYQLLQSVINLLKEYEFMTPAYQKILHKILLYGESHNIFDTKEFVKILPQELLPAFDICFVTPLPEFIDEEHYRQEVGKTVRELLGVSLRKKIKLLGDEIKEKEANANEEEMTQIHVKLQHFVSLLHDIG